MNPYAIIDLHCDTLTGCGYYTKRPEVDSLNDSRRMLSLEKSFEGIHSFDQIIAAAEENSRLLRELSADAANQSEYIRRIAGTPAFRGTSAEYLPLGEVKFRRMLEELEKAEHYIFLEYSSFRKGRCGTPSSGCWSGRPGRGWMYG